MKKNSLLLILLFFSLACEKQDHTKPHSGFLSRDIGSRITLEQADRWKERARVADNGRSQSTTLTISRERLQLLTAAISDYDGVVFHRALENDLHHVVAIPFENGQPLWTPTTIIDSNTDSDVDFALAKEWSESFKAENPNGPWAHFFGRDVIDAILQNPAFEKMELVEGIDDADKKVLLLYAWNTNDSASGRKKGAVLEVYDKSNQCPPFCPE